MAPLAPYIPSPMTYVVEELLFSVVPSNLTFDFDLILGSFFDFWGPNGLFLGFKNYFGVFLYRLITYVLRVLLYLKN